MTKIDDIARAMASRRRELIAQPLQSIWKELAIAAAEAMKDPTEKMVDAGRMVTASWLDVSGSGVTIAREKMRRRFNAVVDAALKEHGA
jgi:cation transport regulator ChaB